MNPIEDLTILKEVLINSSIPDTYRVNAFRCLDLQAFSTMREINKRKQIIEICYSTGASIPKELGINLLRQEVDYSNDINKLIEKIKNPINRLIEEFFWFWPNNFHGDHQDKGIFFLSNNQKEKAAIIWENQLLYDDPKGIALHNLTILKHIELIEMYFDMLYDINSFPSDEIEFIWEKCFQYWQRLIDNEDFWSFLSSRVRDFDDPRLTTGNVRRLRTLIPLSLVLITFRLALSFADVNKNKSAKDIVTLISNQGFNKEILDEASQLAIDPLIKRLNYLSSSAKDNIDTKKIKANLDLHKVLDQGINMIEVIETLEIIRPINEYKDQFAETLSKIAIDYGYNTQNDSAAINLLEKIKSITQNIKIIDDVDYHINDFKERISKGNYWCSKGYYSLNSSTYNSLEVARKKVHQKKFEEAKILLEDLLYSASNSSRNSEVTIINTCLAYCLNMEAMDDFEKAGNIIDYVPTFVKEVADRLSYAENEIRFASWAANNNMLSQACYRRDLHCMACGNFIYDTNNLYTFKWKDLTYVGCYSCANQYKAELKSNRSSVNNYLIKSLKKLNRGYKLNSKNKQIKENLDQIKQIAQSLGISIEEYSYYDNIPNKSLKSDTTSTPKITLENTSTNNNATTFGIVAVIAIIFLSILLCLAISSGTQ